MLSNSVKAVSILALSGMALAATCTGSSPIWNSTTDRASLNTCVTNAVNGDTINLACGTLAGGWASDITISGKQINIIGCGSGSTVIGTSGSPTSGAFFMTGIHATASPSTPSVRISGIDFFLGDGVHFTFEDTQGARLDHMAISKNSTAADQECTIGYGFANVSWGLLDHVTGSYCQFEELGGDFSNDSNGDNLAMSAALTLGTRINFIFEDSTFTKTDPSVNGYFNCWDGHQGGSYVVRFSTLDGCRFEGHGVQADSERSIRTYEIYSNTFLNSNGIQGFRPFLQRGGTGMIFHNTLTASQWIHNEIALDGPRLMEASISNQIPKWEFCDGLGTSANANGTVFAAKGVNVDSGPNNGTTSGYPCRDQIGRPTDDSTWSPGAKPWLTTPPAQSALTPFYAWKNLSTGSELATNLNCEGGVPGDTALCNNMTANLILVNRDFYTYTGSFTGASGIGEGPIASRPATCTTGVRYWATDQGNWNQKVAANTSGLGYKCTATNTWTQDYTPFTYPHPFQNFVPATNPAQISGSVKFSGNVTIAP